MGGAEKEPRSVCPGEERKGLLGAKDLARSAELARGTLRLLFWKIDTLWNVRGFLRRQGEARAGSLKEQRLQEDGGCCFESHWRAPAGFW